MILFGNKITSWDFSHSLDTRSEAHARNSLGKQVNKRPLPMDMRQHFFTSQSNRLMNYDQAILAS